MFGINVFMLLGKRGSLGEVIGGFGNLGNIMCDRKMFTRISFRIFFHLYLI